MLLFTYFTYCVSKYDFPIRTLLLPFTLGYSIYILFQYNLLGIPRLHKA